MLWYLKDYTDLCKGSMKIESLIFKDDVAGQMSVKPERPMPLTTGCNKAGCP